METFRDKIFRSGQMDDPAHGCLVIAEVAQAHDGSLGTAHAFIDAIAETGADAVKFQTHIAAAESTPSEPWRVKFSYQDATRYDYWKRMEFSAEQWLGLKRHANERGLLFLSSPFSLEAVELLEQVGVAAWKIASGELTNIPMFQRLAQSGLPLIVSTGMSGWSEIDQVVATLRETGRPHALLQCTSAYPCPPERVGLNILDEYRTRYGCAVGLSDHSASIFPGLAAASLGAEIVEIHVTLSRKMFGPDVNSSLTIRELSCLVEGVRYVDRMIKHPVDKDAVAADLEPMRKLFKKSIIAKTDIETGTLLQPEHLACKKPGTGLSPERLDEIIGKKAVRTIKKDELLQEGDWV